MQPPFWDDLDFKDLFWSKATVLDKEDACWFWKKPNSNGYGMIWIPANHHRPKGYAQYQAAHRIAWMLEYGEIPPGQLVRHICDGRACVNALEHLELGWHSDNMRDVVMRSSRRHGKLTRRELYRIRKKYRATPRELATIFAVSEEQILHILKENPA